MVGSVEMRGTRQGHITFKGEMCSAVLERLVKINWIV